MVSFGRKRVAHLGRKHLVSFRATIDILRREGLYSSQLTAWRRARREGSLQALAKPRGPGGRRRDPWPARTSGCARRTPACLPAAASESRIPLALRENQLPSPHLYGIARPLQPSAQFLGSAAFGVRAWRHMAGSSRNLARRTGLVMGAKARSYRIASGVVSTEVEGEVVLVDPHTEEFMGLNKAGSIIWDGLARGDTIGQIAEMLRGEYDDQTADFEADVREFLDSLLGRNLIEFEGGDQVKGEGASG